MIRNNLILRIVRNKISHDYKFDKQKNDFSNNIKNNTKDFFILLKNGSIIFKCLCQSVANHPDYSYTDSIKQCLFNVKCFVDPRNFHGEIHGIINAIDLDNQPIDNFSMQLDNGFQKGRWLIHDRYSFEKKRDLNNAYSGGCFILSSKDLEEFNKILKTEGIDRDDLIMGELWEV